MTTYRNVGAGGAPGQPPPETDAPGNRRRGDRARERADKAVAGAASVGAPPPARNAAGSTHTRRPPDFYADPAFRRLPHVAREALIVLWTHGDTLLCGIVRDADDKVARALGVRPGAARSAVGELVEEGDAAAAAPTFAVLGGGDA
jgi:hypothetical protein